AVAGALAAQGAPVAGERSCIVCHAAAARAVALSPHGGLLTRADTAARSCTVCHGDLSAHVARQARPTATDPEVGPPVAATACASCHAGRDLAPAAGTHPAVALRSESPRLPEPSAAVVRALERREHDGGFDWSGLVEFGYRFVRVTGSQARFDTDVDLDD